MLSGAPEEIRTPDPQIRSLVLYSGAAMCLIIPCSSAPTLSNNIMQKGLAFGRGGASVVRCRRRFNRTEDLDVKVREEALSSLIRSGWWCSKTLATDRDRSQGQERQSRLE